MCRCWWDSVLCFQSILLPISWCCLMTAFCAKGSSVPSLWWAPCSKMIKCHACFEETVFKCKDCCEELEPDVSFQKAGWILAIAIVLAHVGALAAWICADVEKESRLLLSSPSCWKWFYFVQVHLRAENPDLALGVGVCGGVPGDGHPKGVRGSWLLAGHRTHSDF